MPRVVDAVILRRWLLSKKRSVDREIRIGLLVFDRDRAGSSTRAICFVRYVVLFDVGVQKRGNETK